MDAGRCVLEIKTRGPRGRTVKERHDYSRDLADQLDEIRMQFLSSCPLVGADGARLRPVLRTRYERSTLVVAERVRVTIDLGLEASTPEGLDLRLMGMAVVETKTRGATSDADRDCGRWVTGLYASRNSARASRRCILSCPRTGGTVLCPGPGS